MKISNSPGWNDISRFTFATRPESVRALDGRRSRSLRAVPLKAAGVTPIPEATRRRDVLWNQVLNTRLHNLPTRRELPRVDFGSVMNSDRASLQVRARAWLGDAFSGVLIGTAPFLFGNYFFGPPGALVGACFVPLLAVAALAFTLPVATATGLGRLVQAPQSVSARAELVPTPGSSYTGLFASGAPCLLSVVVGRTGAYLRAEAFGENGSCVWHGGEPSQAGLKQWARADAHGHTVLNAREPENALVTNFVEYGRGMGIAEEVSRSRDIDWRDAINDGALTEWNIYARRSDGLFHAATLHVTSHWVASSCGDAKLR